MTVMEVTRARTRRMEWRAGVVLPVLLALVAALAPGSRAAAQVVSALKAHDDSQPIMAEARSQVLLEDEQVAVLEGDAVIRQGDLELKADRIAIRYETGEDAARPRVRRMEARGHVRLKSPSEEVTADWGIYDVASRMILMGGGVELRRAGNLLTGSLMEIDLDSGLIRLSAAGAEDGRVKGLFRPPERAPQKETPPPSGPPTGGKDRS